MFNISLMNDALVSKLEALTEIRYYDMELDDESSILFDICDLFNKTSGMKFMVSGFGQDEWPVDCKYDLVGVMEELPEIIRHINRDDYNFRLYLYEQGVEREIIFKETDGNVSLTCLSNTNWIPKPSTIEMSKEEVEKIFKNLYLDFVFFSTNLCGKLIKHPLLSNWISSFEE